jgi:hypothetical protein
VYVYLLCAALAGGVTTVVARHHQAMLHSQDEMGMKLE